MVCLDTVLVRNMGGLEPLANIPQCRHLILLHNGCVLKIPCDAYVRSIQSINQFYQFIRLAGVTLTGRDIPVPEVFDGDANASMGRMKEALHYMQVMERPLMVVSDADDLDVPEASLVKIPKTEYEVTSPIMSFIPGALLAGYVSSMSGEPYSRGFRTHWQFAEDASAIHKSNIEIVK